MATNSELKSFEFAKGTSASAKRKGTLDAQPDATKLVAAAQNDNEVSQKEKAATKEESTEETKPTYDPEMLAAIFDDLMFQGEYTENIKVKDKLLVTLRTRTSEESEEIAIALDTLGANLFTTLEQKRSLLNLQYSLVRYHNKDLSGLSKTDKAKFLGQLPTPVIVALVNELAKFDEKVFAALKEGEESF